MENTNEELKRDYEEEINVLKKTDVGIFYLFLVFREIFVQMRNFHVTENEERRYY